MIVISTSQDKYHTGMDGSLSSRESRDFNDAISYVKQFSQNHHFDDSHSQAASLSNQLGADLREAETASRNVDASLAKSHAHSECQKLRGISFIKLPLI
ncbi:hypothetical protein PGH45_19180 [Legionella pneumophila]|nr:hypothetical protein [Legionella pneumophila]